jgi:hypothetical protein
VSDGSGRICKEATLFRFGHCPGIYLESSKIPPPPHFSRFKCVRSPNFAIEDLALRYLDWEITDSVLESDSGYPDVFLMVFSISSTILQ